MTIENQEYGQTKVKITIFGKEVTGRQVVLPLPPSVNNKVEPNYSALRSMAYGNSFANAKKGRGGMIKNTTAYNRWINFARCELRKGKYEKLKGEVVAFVNFVFKDRRTQDADNRIKALFDSFTLSECLIDDDRYISNFTSSKYIIKGKEFVQCFLVEKEQLGKLPFELTVDYLDGLCSRKENDNE